ncbi:hypothetical protein IWQ62_005317 [Dispira parvispora]|uniref:EamA domain-containing protein n=1 Tax=Dispira parvispora TaxID=1520584 RepID=A0A9W8E154_9FUNG|nr:hypothetical protein IWQ62_005317 [Dispira parvispora]
MSTSVTVSDRTPEVPPNERTTLLPSSVGSQVPPSRNANRESLGLVYMTASALGFSAMSLFVKLSGSKFPTMEIVFARSIWQVTMALLWCGWQGIHPLGPPAHRRWLLVRGTTGTLGLACFFYGLTHLPLADATVVFFSNPVFTAILAHLALGERFTGVDKLASLLCAVGIILVAKPSFLFGTGQGEDALPGRLVGVVITLFGALMGAMGYVIVRKIGGNVHFLTHVVYFGGISALFSGFAMLGGAGFVLPSDITDYGMLCTVGVASFVGQSFLNKGLQLSPAGPATLMRNLDVVFAFGFGIALFGEIPDVLSISGALLIVGCTVGMALRKWLL